MQQIIETVHQNTKEAEVLLVKYTCPGLENGRPTHRCMAYKT